MQFEQLFLTVVQGAQTFVNSLTPGNTAAIQSPNIPTIFRPSTYVRINGDQMWKCMHVWSVHFLDLPVPSLSGFDRPNGQAPEPRLIPRDLLFDLKERTDVQLSPDGRMVRITHTFKSYCIFIVKSQLLKITNTIIIKLANQITFMAPLNNVTNLWIVNIATLLRDRNIQSAIPLTNDTDEGIQCAFGKFILLREVTFTLNSAKMLPLHASTHRSSTFMENREFSVHFWTYYPNTVMYKQKIDGFAYGQYFQMGNRQ